MTLILSHGPWSVTIAQPADSRPAFEPHYTLNERAQVDTTYHWNWKGQDLAGVSNCTFTFANPDLHSLTTWSTSLGQRAWYDVTPAGIAQGPASVNDASNDSDDPAYVPIELSARYFWESDSSAGRALENWPVGA
ncbi:hypothetical protein [Pseudomonas putida]|uniref:hypothetical protein n=1 Tax=Pseudomonas putida TaxID=303 RepID=UPI00236569AB|nr:hypothetical protein [Pseudomonas putida]MDD2048375.1 hypothetical protein [Pseudomonas putida]